MGSYLSQAIAEPVLVYHQLLAEASTRPDGVLAGADGVVVTAVRSAAKGLKPGATMDERAHAMETAMKDLTMEQKKAVLNKVLETRKAK